MKSGELDAHFGPVIQRGTLGCCWNRRDTDRKELETYVEVEDNAGCGIGRHSALPSGEPLTQQNGGLAVGLNSVKRSILEVHLYLI